MAYYFSEENLLQLCASATAGKEFWETKFIVVFFLNCIHFLPVLLRCSGINILCTGKEQKKLMEDLTFISYTVRLLTTVLPVGDSVTSYSSQCTIIHSTLSFNDTCSSLFLIHMNVWQVYAHPYIRSVYDYVIIVDKDQRDCNDQ